VPTQAQPRTWRRFGVPTVAVTLAALALTAGCSSDGSGTAAEEEPTIGSSPSEPTTSSEPSASPSANASPAGLRSSYPGSELEFTDLPQTKGRLTGALESYLTFEALLRKSFRTAELEPRLRAMTSPALANTLASGINTQKAESIRYDGPTTIAVDTARGAANVAALTSCIDVSDTVQVVDGSPQPLDGPPKVKVTVVLTEQGQGWTVTEYSSKGEAC
jgi:hypothetical protein